MTIVVQSNGIPCVKWDAICETNKRNNKLSEFDGNLMLKHDFPCDVIRYSYLIFLLFADSPFRIQ